MAGADLYLVWLELHLYTGSYDDLHSALLTDTGCKKTFERGKTTCELPRELYLCRKNGTDRDQLRDDVLAVVNGMNPAPVSAKIIVVKCVDGHISSRGLRPKPGLSKARVVHWAKSQQLKAKKRKAK